MLFNDDEYFEFFVISFFSVDGDDITMKDRKSFYLLAIHSKESEALKVMN